MISCAHGSCDQIFAETGDGPEIVCRGFMKIWMIESVVLVIKWGGEGAGGGGAGEGGAGAVGEGFVFW